MSGAGATAETERITVPVAPTPTHPVGYWVVRVARLVAGVVALLAVVAVIVVGGALVAPSRGGDVLGHSEIDRRTESLVAEVDPAGPSRSAVDEAVVAPTGRWGPVEDWPLVAIHAVLTADGDVLTYGTNADGQQTGRFIYDVWTPQFSAAGGHVTLENTTRTDLFCNLQLNRAETGEVLMFGGDNFSAGSTTNTGNADIVSFDPATNAIGALPGMHLPRWYGTGVTLPDGSFYIQGGLGGEAHPEHWSAETGSVLLDLDTSGMHYWYPRLFVVPDGRIFGFDTTGAMFYLSPELDEIVPAGRLEIAGHLRGSTAVMFEPGKILQFGGMSTASHIIDVTGPEPVVTRTGTLDRWRRWVSATLLPDGRVLATGGSDRDSQALADWPIERYDVITEAEIWDPATGEWTPSGSAVQPRLYHSSVLLLPDGRVLTAGGGAPGPITNSDAELYSPDYLLSADGSAAPRPVVESISATVTRPGDPLTLTVAEGSDVDRVTLVKTGSSTHSTDMDTRFIELEFVVSGTEVGTELPDSGTVLTPGSYLVTVLDGAGVPSESEIITVLPAGDADQL